MQTATKERTLQWICNQHKNGNISFSHKLQRPINQWSTRMKSLLIHSLLIGFPVNPIYLVEEGGVSYTLDGSQRTSSCIAYINNEFSLSKDTPNVTIVANKDGETIKTEYEIAGKKFEKLDEEVQSTLLACCLSFCTLSDYTNEDVKEMFKRQNSQKALNGKLLRIVYESDEFSETVYSLANHPFMDKVTTPTQRKGGTDRDVIVQTFMLMATNNEHEFVSFKSKDMDTFVKEYADNISNDKIEALKIAMDKFNEAFDEIKIPVTSLAMILYAGYRIVRDKKSFSKLVELVDDFLENYDTNEEYKQYVLNGTGQAVNVRGRFDYWRNLIKTA